MENVIYEVIKNVLEEKSQKKISKEDKINSLGLDSIQYVEVILEIEQIYNINFPIEKMVIDENECLDSLVHLVQIECGKRTK